MSTKWNMQIPFPKDNYQIRIVDAKFGASKRTDNPMITIDFEVVSPEVVIVDNKEITVAGVPFKYYLVTKVMEGDEVDGEKTAGWQAKVKELFSKLKLDADTIDFDNPDLSALPGLTVWALLTAPAKAKRKDPTPAQKAKGEQGDILTDPITGQKQVTYYPEIDNHTIYGLVPAA